MGKKTNPIGFRLSVNKNWKSRWFATGFDCAQNVIEDSRIRELIYKKR